MDMSILADMNMSIDLLRLAAINSAKTQAVGGSIPQALVKYAKKAVPDRMTGSCTYIQLAPSDSDDH